MTTKFITAVEVARRMGVGMRTSTTNTQALGHWPLDAEPLTEEAHRFIATSVR